MLNLLKKILPSEMLGKFFIFGGTSCLFSACAGATHEQIITPLPRGSTSTTINAIPLTSQSDASIQSVTVQLSYVLPENGFSSESTRLSLLPENKITRVLQYISTSNTKITITVTPLGGSAVSYGPTACTTVSCVVSFTAVPGPTKINFKLTDGTNTLSQFDEMTIVQPSTINTMNFTANPVVNSVTLQLASNTIAAGTTGSLLLTVNAKDADGNTIVGSGNYVDINGNPLALLLTTDNNQAGGTGAITIQGPLRILSPNHAPIYVIYNGKWLNSSTVSVQSTQTIAGSLTAATLTTLPGVATEYTVPSSNSYPFQITSGPDGNIWFTEYLSYNVAKLTMSGNVTEYPTPPGNQPVGITSGPDGNLWICEGGSSYVAKVTTNGVMTQFPTTGISQDISVGLDRKLWFSEPDVPVIGAITTSGSLTEYNVTSGTFPGGIALGPDGNEWFAETGGNKIGKITTSGAVVEYSIPTSASAPYGLVKGPDGNMWFCESNGNNIGRITTSGVITEFPVPTASSTPYYLAVGSDNNIWFTENTGNKIGRITTSGVITEYPIPTASAGPIGITAGPDGNIWFAESTANKIGKIVL